MAPALSPEILPQLMTGFILQDKYQKRQTKPVFLGPVQIGGKAPVVVQSMTNTDTRDVVATLKQIEELARAGCEVVRVAVPDQKAAAVLGEIKKASPLPVVADIHFSSQLACLAIRSGVDGIRINPGNMKPEGIKKVVREARKRAVVIRVGVNAGSLNPELLRKHGGPTAAALVEAALAGLAILEDLGHEAIKVSLKSSDVPTMIAAYRKLARLTDYPLHLGVTEAGTLLAATLKSALGIGSLLAEGIGDTIRVSVTGNPVEEMPIAWGILRALNLRRRGPDIISCPTCGRCEIDLPRLVAGVEERLRDCREYLKIALMGCVVNGPGEASHADIGLAGGRQAGKLFVRGKVIRTVPERDFIPALLEEIEKLLAQKKEVE
jgi:(E)-4-hydroxy-3-methylbut-2-enyl-diphosphate synthase